MHTIQKSYFVMGLSVLFSAMVLASCGKTIDLQHQLSGVWEDRISHKTVELRLVGESKTVSFDGHQYPAMVDSIDKDRGQIRLKVTNGSGAPEVWVLSQTWEDVDRFNIVLERGNQKEVLIPKNKA